MPHWRGSSTQDDPCRSNIGGVATPATPAALTPMVPCGCAVVGFDGAPGGGEGGAEEDDDGEDAEEEGGGDAAAAAQGAAGDVVAGQEAQRADAPAAPVQTGRTRQGTRGGNCKPSCSHFGHIFRPIGTVV